MFFFVVWCVYIVKIQILFVISLEEKIIKFIEAWKNYISCLLKKFYLNVLM
jgi:hypothetical protein